MKLTAAQKKNIIKRMYLDIFFFAKVILGDKEYPMHYHVRNETPPFHKEIVSNLLELTPGEKIAVVSPRGHAKSTLCSLIYPLHRILFGEERFVLLISESEMQSKYLLEALGDEIEFNEKLHYFFGNRMGEVWGKEEKEIITGFKSDGTPSGSCKVMVRGTGQKVRGLKYGAYRPTLTIIDDGEGDANAATMMQRDKFRRWLDTAVIPGSDDAKLVFVGTIIDEDSYLNNVAGSRAFDGTGERKVKGWKSLFYQAILQDSLQGEFISSGMEIKGKDGDPLVLWPDRRPYGWLVKKREEARSKGDLSYFFQEYQNVPMDDAFRVFKKENILYYDGKYVHEDGIDYMVVNTSEGVSKKPVNIFMGVDPASSENIKANYTVVMIVALDKHHNFYVVDYFRGQVSPMDGADKIFDLADRYHPKLINIEKTGHVMLADYMRRKSKETGRHLNIVPKNAIQKKFYRIKELQPIFASNSMYLKDTHHELEQELLGFKEHGTSTKDTLDALKWATEDTYAPDVEKTDEGSWKMPEHFTGCDWETGEMLLN